VVADREAEFVRYGGLTLLDPGIDELLHPTAVEAQDVIVVRPGVELEHRHAIGEVMARDEARRLKLSEHAIHRGKPDVLAGIDELAIDVLGRQVASPTVLENLENLDARQRHLQSRLAQIVAFHVEPRPFG